MQPESDEADHAEQCEKVAEDADELRDPERPEGRLGEDRARRDRLHYGLRFSHAGNSQIAPPWREPRPRYR
jgi:hypothetical protein